MPPPATGGGAAGSAATATGPGGGGKGRMKYVPPPTNAGEWNRPKVGSGWGNDRWTLMQTCSEFFFLTLSLDRPLLGRHVFHVLKFWILDEVFELKIGVGPSIISRSAVRGI